MAHTDNVDLDMTNAVEAPPPSEAKENRKLAFASFWMVAVLLVVIPIWALRWLLKYRKIEADDAEFRKARSTVKWIGIIVAVALVGFVALNVLVFLSLRPER